MKRTNQHSQRPILLGGLLVLVATGVLADQPDTLDWDRSFHRQIRWIPQPTWLGNPAGQDEHRVRRDGDVVQFLINRPGRGMKWAWDLPQPVSLESRPYVSIRYRSEGTRAHGDYALCAIGKMRTPGPDYLAIVSGYELIRDGRWHTLHVDIRPVAAKLPVARALAVQVQAGLPRAVLEVADVRLVDAPQPTRLADLLDLRPVETWDRFISVSIGPVAGSQSSSWRERLRIADWFAGREVTVDGIPFKLRPEGPDLAATPIEAKTQLRFPVDAAAGEVYLLLLAEFVGQQEPAYGSGKLRAIRDVDRFRLRLQYEDGTVDECLPMDVSTRRFGVVEGPQVVVAAADRWKPLRAVILRDLAKQGAFAVAAVTLRTDAERGFPEALEETPPLRPVAGAKRSGAPAGRGSGASQAQPPATPDAASATDTETTSKDLLSNRWLTAEIPSDGPPILKRLVHRPTSWDYLSRPALLLKLHVDGSLVPAEDIQRMGLASDGFHWHRIRRLEGLRLGMSVDVVERDGLSIRAAVHNNGRQEHSVALAAPAVGPYRLAAESEDAYYLFPKCGAVFDNRPCSYRARYSGRFPLQFVDTFSPRHGRGLSLQTADTACLQKHYVLEKKDGLLTMAVEYPQRVLKPGHRFETAPAILRATDGDWHRGLETYGRWLRSWHRPLSPRQEWFRRVFNFRQRFLWQWDPLYDSQHGTFRLETAVEEARREFGGIDYLHLFDWGNCGKYGRIYGRTGDYSPYDYLQGGRAAFRQAIAGVQARGVPVGLYIEGYLLQEKGRLGQKHGPEWQLIGPDGRGKYWPASSEMMICAAAAGWRTVQASTYTEKVRQLDVDGMYLDQFGFAGEYKDCHSTDHGHPVPSFAVAAERDCTQMVRRAIDRAKPNVAFYTEETPVDVTSQYQDGSFTYSLFHTQRTQTLVPLNAARFALPDFKTIEILFCDKPTGSWATGVKWIFFNGEAIWLEGPAATWFEPQTRSAIRRCYRILQKHRDAFATTGPVALVPTETGGVFANAFPAADRTVYTFYNSRHRTLRGPVLRLPHQDGTTFHDEWRQRPASVRRDGNDAVIHLELGPQDVGCVVVRH